MPQPVPVPTPAEALRVAAELGPYFSVDTEPGPGWLTLDALISDPDALVGEVSRTRRGLAGQARSDPDRIADRTAASIFSLGLFARLLSPVLGAAALAGAVPTLSVPTVWWRPATAGPLPIAMQPRRVMAAATPPELADLMSTEVLVPCIEPLVTAVHERFRLSRKVIVGNIASALNGAASVIGATHPDHGATAITIATGLLGRPLLTGAGAYRTADGQGFRRRSCCLLYRVPAAGMCGDCVLRPLR